MEFKGTVIITDPCYVAKGNDWGNGIFSWQDWGLRRINAPEIKHYLWESTDLGDGSWEIAEILKLQNRVETENFVENLDNAFSNFLEEPGITNKVILEDLIHQQKHIGRFSVDSGSFGIFYLDELLDYNPTFLRDHGIWLYTIIPDFIGEISVLRKENKEFHIIGLGNKTFYSK